MLTSFFSNSKPIHFIIVSLLIFSGYSIYLFQEINDEFSFLVLMKSLLQVGVFIILLLILNFIIKKNKLTQVNSYALFLFSCFILTVPNLFKESEIVFSSLFLLLALRRILSLSSKKSIQKKIIDASIWISVATLFYFWSILFIILLYVAIIQLSSKNYKLNLIPIVGVISIFIITTAYHLIAYNNLWWFLENLYLISFDFSSYYNLKVLTPTVFIFLLGIISVFFKILNFSNIPLKEKSKYWILIITFIISIVVIIITDNKNGSEILFLCFPTSILLTGLIEFIQKKWISEIVLWLVLIAPFVIYLT